MDNKSYNSYNTQTNKVDSIGDFSDKPKLNECFTNSFINFMKFDETMSVDAGISLNNSKNYVLKFSVKSVNNKDSAREDLIRKKHFTQNYYYTEGLINNSLIEQPKELKPSTNSLHKYPNQLKSKFFSSNLENIDKHHDDEDEETMLYEFDQLNLKCLESPDIGKSNELLFNKEGKIKKNSLFNPLSKYSSNKMNEGTKELRDSLPNNVESKEMNTYIIQSQESTKDLLYYTLKEQQTKTNLHNTENVTVNDFNLIPQTPSTFVHHQFSIKSCKEQAGCRILQKQMAQIPNYANSFLYPQIKYFIIELSIDQFGNYLIQKLLEYLDQSNINEFLSIICNKLVYVSNNQHGTRVVQRLIDFLSDKMQRAFIVNVVRSNLVSLVLNSQGCHIVTKLLSIFDPEDFLPLHEYFLINMEKFVKDKFGCCVVKKLIERSESSYKDTISTDILKNFIQYLTDPYGNYVLQLCITFNNQILNSKILDYVKNNFNYYSMEKYSSNVIEKALYHCLENSKNDIISILINDEQVAVNLLCSIYGNYVLQRALIVANNNDREIILQYVKRNFNKLNSTQFGNKLKMKLMALYPSLTANPLSLLQKNNQFPPQFDNNMYTPYHNMYNNPYYNNFIYSQNQQFGNNMYPQQQMFIPNNFQGQSIQQPQPYVPNMNMMSSSPNIYYIPYNNVNNYYIQK